MLGFLSRTRRLGRRPEAWLLGVCLVGLGLAAGCQSWPGDASDKVSNPNFCPAYERGSIPAPLGTYVNEHNRRQAEKAELDDFVFYNYEFNEEGTALGPAGCRHVIQVAMRLKGNAPFPVIIESTGFDKIDQARRALIVSRLGTAGVADADQRVMIGCPIAEGLYGDEAPRIYQQIITGGFNFQGGFGNFGFAPQNFGFGGGNFTGGGFGYVGGLGGFGSGFVGR